MWFDFVVAAPVREGELQFPESNTYSLGQVLARANSRCRTWGDAVEEEASSRDGGVEEGQGGEKEE